MLMDETFPRTAALPKQSPLYWVQNKDRYLRQILIRDIQDQTDRDLIVYFTDTDRSTLQIDGGDDQHLIELLRGCKRGKVDLLLETGGGVTDATEKVCAILRKLAPDLRVFVPRRAKSNGTVIALAGQAIVMSASSELGPIDPSFNNVPVEFILNAPPGAANPLELQLAQTYKRQTMKLASALLSSGMMRDKPEMIELTVQKLASRDHYHSHGSVIDAEEAANLGLNIDYRDENDELWRRVWLLRSMYSHDCGTLKMGKIFEGETVSSAVASSS